MDIREDVVKEQDREQSLRISIKIDTLSYKYVFIPVRWFWSHPLFGPTVVRGIIVLYPVRVSKNFIHPFKDGRTSFL